MIKELRNFQAICDLCGFDQEYTSNHKRLPLGWRLVLLKEHKGTRLEGESHDLCPECAVKFENGELKNLYY